MIALPVTCPQCGVDSWFEFPVQVVVIALTSWNNMALRASCHEESWSATESELTKIRDHLGAAWIEANRQVM
jgi:hypothetical protein